MCSNNAVANPQDPNTPPSVRLERVGTDISSFADICDMNSPCTNYTSLSALSMTLLLPPSILAFSLHFPFIIPGVAPAAVATYVPAWYHYDSEHTKFDNTPWTWGTDYLLTAVMGIICYFILTTPGKASRLLKYYSAALLACYAVSTLAGGYAHQTIRGVDMLNSPMFRVLWIICVGNVSFASCWMGLIGREVVHLFDSRPIPKGPAYLWPMYGSFMTLACALGYMSFKRPACDIFIAGITQFPTTLYCLAGLILGVRNNAGQKKHDHRKESMPMDSVLLRYRVMYYVGFIGNAPLLPMYPLLVQYTSMSLAQINTLLHSWLMVMWGMQGLSLLHLCRVVGGWEEAKKLAHGKKD